MPIDMTKNIDRFEAEDTRQLTLTMTVTRPATVAFTVYNTDGRTLALEAMQSTATVAESAVGAVSSTGLYHFERVLPTSVGFYTYEWRAWDTGSRTYIERGEFEVIHTEAHSFFSYADLGDTTRAARQVFARGDITFREIRPYMEQADSWIDVRLGSVVTVPVSPTPLFLRGMSKVGALYFYYSERYSIEREAAPPAIVEEWEKYNELLDGVVAGSMALPGVTIEDQISLIPESQYKPIFDLRDWELQRVDPDLVRDENDRDRDGGDLVR